MIEVLSGLVHEPERGPVEFDWDVEKALANRAKHGVSFEQAAELLESELDYLELFDEEHSVHEDRFISIGPTSAGLLVVVWTETQADVVRIISARHAARAEAEFYRRIMGDL